MDSSMLLVVEGGGSLLELGDKPVRAEKVGGFMAMKDREILRVTIEKVFEDVILQEASRKIRQLEEKMSHSQKSFAMSFSVSGGVMARVFGRRVTDLKTQARVPTTK